MSVSKIRNSRELRGGCGTVGKGLTETRWLWIRSTLGKMIIHTRKCKNLKLSFLRPEQTGALNFATPNPMSQKSNRCMWNVVS